MSIANKCQQCEEITQNAKFCSRSCSAKHNNAAREKKSFPCSVCGEVIGQGYARYSRRKYCDSCNPQNVDWSQVSLEELQSRRKYQKNSQIRDAARSIAKKLPRFERCANCGYGKHVEVCHVVAISSFPPDAKVSEVNSLDNIVGLCPNCHWEFDNNLLDFKEDWLQCVSEGDTLLKLGTVV